MPLDEYKRKRSFDKTPEPTGGKPTGSKLLFVIQKHDASHLHYDLRLELKGVLKSWAVPKGLSMDPSVRRLAMLVEDHPWDYKDFEGIIPSGYGAGTVIVWDQGTYETTAIKDASKTAQEKSILGQFWKGAISFTLHGKKLKGNFKIVRSKDKDDRTWYVMKAKDAFATTTDITLKDKSVISGKTLRQIEANPPAEWQSHKPSISKKKSAADTSTPALLKKIGVKAPMPQKVEPMACTLIRENFNEPSWLYELKIDGYRIIVHIKSGKIKLFSRSGLDFTKKYPQIVSAFSNWKHDAIIDGELTVLNKEGLPDFDMLQKYKGEEPIVFYAFDLIWVDGYDITAASLETRKGVLANIIPAGDMIKFTEHFDDSKKLFEQVKKMKLEGIVAKKRDSTYQIGQRSKDWLKLPTEIRQEFVIGGWTESESGRSFRSLLFGAFDKGKFYFIGHAGLGYKERQMAEILNVIKKHEVKPSPFANDIDASTQAHFVKPVLVGNFKFATWTAQGKIRKPAIFLGFRDDKDPKTVTRELPLTSEEESKITKKVAAEKPFKQKKGKSALMEDSNWRELDKLPISTKDSIIIDGKDVELTNVEKQLWTSVTKADLITYYNGVADIMLPYLKDRAQSIHIKHNGPLAPGMYIKDMEGRQPDWAEIFTTPRKHKKAGKRDMIDYLVCNDKATLLYLINLGCIDINPWTSRITDPLHPDYIIIDLDPSDNDFDKVIKTAIAAKKVFDKMKIKAFPKTSGKTGMHLYIPCIGFTFPEARKIAESICVLIQSVVPEIATTENSISERGSKLFVDYNQNDEADTVAAPYCVRPYKHPTVSTPLLWREINAKLDPVKFDIYSTPDRIITKGDLFRDVNQDVIRSANSRVLLKLLSVL